MMAIAIISCSGVGGGGGGGGGGYATCTSSNRSSNSLQLPAIPFQRFEGRYLKHRTKIMV